MNNNKMRLEYGFALVFLVMASILACLLIPPSPALANGRTLEQVIAQFEDMKRQVELKISKSDATIRKTQKIIALARERGNTSAESIARQALERAQQAKVKNQRTRSEIEQTLQGLYRLRGKEGEIQKARERIAELREDVKELQFALQIYGDALMQKSGALEDEGKRVSQMSDKILVDGVEYLKGGAFLGLAKLNFEYWKKDEYKKYKKIIGYVENLMTEKDVMTWMNSRPDDLAKLVEGADLLASTVVPGWDHAKVNFKAWSTVAKECLAWRKINLLNRSTEDYSRAVAGLSTRMRAKVSEITCLKKCMDQYIVGCVEKCSQRE